MRTYNIIYLDLDGVFADFRKSFDKIVGHPYDEDPQGAWSKLEKVDRLFLNLDPLPGAKDMFDEIQSFGIQTKILTALPRLTGKLHTSVEDKTNWVREHLSSDIEVICTDGWRGKRAYSNQSSILVDDMVRNTIDWIDAGGSGVLHFSNQYTLHQLRNILLQSRQYTFS